MVTFDIDDNAPGNDRNVVVSSGSVCRGRCSAVEKAAIIGETLVPGARISDVARGWQKGSQQIYRWRHSAGVTHHGRPMRRGQPAAPDFVPIMPADAAAPVALSNPVIEISLAGAVVRVVSGLDNAQLAAVLRAVRVSALRP